MARSKTDDPTPPAAPEAATPPAGERPFLFRGSERTELELKGGAVRVLYPNEIHRLDAGDKAVADLLQGGLLRDLS